ncbi:MAG: hypothetical protein V1898_00165 [Patescibacteria group bacterium]
MDEHIETCLKIFSHIQNVLNIKHYTILPMNRRFLKNARSYTAGYINFAKQKIVIDVYTPAKAKPKSYASIIRTLAHEVAHIQKPPYRSLYKGRIILRQHYPEFYTQTNKNVELLKKDKYLKKFF